MFKSVIASLIVASVFTLAIGCGSNADNLGQDDNMCAAPGTGCSANEQGHTCGNAVCCGGAWYVGKSCPSSPAPTPTTPAPTPTPANDGGITQNPGPSPTQPVKDGEQTWCGNSFRTIRIVWAGIPANGYTARRGAWASPVIKGATGVKSDFRAWPSQKPGEYLDTWLEMDRNVTYSTATFEEDAKICSGHSLMVSLYDNHTDGRPAYSPAANCDGTTSFYENNVKLTPRCVLNNAADGWNYIVD